MSIKILDIKNRIDELVPLEYKESYDNVGLMVGKSDVTVTNVLIALDCTLDVIDEAIQNDCNLIITHHPILFKRPYNITDETLLGKKLIKLIENEIGVYSSHTNLDSINDGLNFKLMGILGYSKCEIIDKTSENSGIGRIATLENPILLSKVIENLKSKLNIPMLRYSANEDKIIKRLAVINGSGQDYFEKAKSMGADCIITGDTSYHYVLDYKEEGIAIIDAEHFYTEWESFKLFGELLEKEFKNMGFNNRVIVSLKSNNPYKYK
ncbi:MAG: Nif3-like dinuclear metal center hexameric protein [Clostridiaceae bacterium]